MLLCAARFATSFLAKSSSEPAFRQSSTSTNYRTTTFSRTIDCLQSRISLFSRETQSRHLQIERKEAMAGGDTSGNAEQQELPQEEGGAQQEPVWCPEQQIYIGGVVPRTESSPDLESLLEQNKDGSLLIFGYGSLCWHPGTGILAHPNVTTSLGRAVGWKRCWAQKSADHRGNPRFNGIVCTLLSDEEVRSLKEHNANKDVTSIDPNHKSSLTEGLVYKVPKELVEECLVELDFREKGGYSRDVIDVILDQAQGSTTYESISTTTSKALLYRGTPDNPAFWKRALLDLNFAAGIMATSTGPSGPNDVYLFQLDTFLSQSSQQLHISDSDHSGDLDTKALAEKTRQLQSSAILYYLQGCGSNQHNQLLQSSSTPTISKDEDVPHVEDLILAVPQHERKNEDPQSAGRIPENVLIQSVHAGGGHSAIINQEGTCYLWGWNEQGQLGRPAPEISIDTAASPLPLIPLLSLANKGGNCDSDRIPLFVDQISLGHAHTLLVEKGTGVVFAFGDNSRGQVTSAQNGGVVEKSVFVPTTTDALQGIACSHVAAGVFHSAVIARENGKVILFGAKQQPKQPWGPSDGSRFVDVKCGQKHTLLLDDRGRVWTIGQHNGNKHGQLGTGESVEGDSQVQVPQLVSGPLGETNIRCVAIDCGWSHNAALIETINERTRSTKLYVWGRNDKGQLGLGDRNSRSVPTEVASLPNIPDRNPIIESVHCGSESTLVVVSFSQAGKSTKLYASGWNEHGNLGLGFSDDSSDHDDVLQFRKIPSVSTRRVVNPDIIGRSSNKPNDGTAAETQRTVSVAAGGAHVLVVNHAK
jgi:alpha-tubulin suppressor-like RCC1 family protein/cation transport regulator ChaC